MLNKVKAKADNLGVDILYIIKIVLPDDVDEFCHEYGRSHLLICSDGQIKGFIVRNLDLASMDTKDFLSYDTIGIYKPAKKS